MEKALVTLLLSNAGVTALVGDRVSPSTRPQGSALPAITYQLITGAPLYADDGDAGLREDRIQLDCWAATYTGAKDTARAVADVLSAFVGTSEGVELQYVLLNTEQDLRETGSKKSKYPFRTRMDFIVWHK